MTHKERLRAALAGEPTDRVPISLWGHDFAREWSAEGLAQATIEAYRRYDLDLVKVNPRFTYYFEAWGSRYEPTGTSQPRRLINALARIEELADLPEIDPTEGVFGDQIEALRMIVATIGAEVDVIQTAFNALTIASNLLDMSPAEFVEAAAGNPAAVHAGLARISRVIADYGVACLGAGASGVFFATVDWGTRDAATEDFYREYGRPYDLQVLAAVRDAPLNVLHVCRDHNLLDLLSDYPVAIFNWDVHGAGNASLQEFASKTDRGVMGGIDLKLVQEGTAAAVHAQVKHDFGAARPARVIAAGGCSIDPGAPAANLDAITSALRD